jgi:hypothetical protein
MLKDENIEVISNEDLYEEKWLCRFKM